MAELRASTSVLYIFFVYFTQKTYFFYFTLSLLQNTYISLFILQDISIKYSFFSIFLLFLSTTLYLHTLSLSLSLSKTTNLDHFFTGQSRSFLHRSIHKPSSTSTDLSLCWFVCAGWFVCVCVFLC